jgi:cytochrome c-type biogenesis protein CcmE
MTSITPPTTWEKTATSARPKTAISNRLKFGFFSALLLSAISFLLISGTINGGRYFITVESMLARTDLTGKTVKVSGAVIGDTIKFDQATNTITFTMANVTDDTHVLEQQGGLAKVLHAAVNNPDAKRVEVVVRNQPMPDLLRNEAQAIVTGKLGADGLFYADELNLKCPSKYEGDVPGQSEKAS